MKIGIDARPLISARPTGIGIYLVNILKYLREWDKENTYYLYADHEIENDISLGDNFIKRIIPGKISLFWITYTLPQILMEDGIEVFWGTYHNLPLKREGIKYVLTVHDLAFMAGPAWTDWLRNLLWNIYVPMSIENADRVIAISQATKRDILRFSRAKEDKIKVVYNGGPGFDFAREEESEAAEYGRYFLDIGTISPRKNMEALVLAFDLLADEIEDIRLVLAGDVGRGGVPVIRLVQTARHRDRIVLPGYVQAKQRNDLLEHAAAFVYPSHYEGFGIPVLEAMMHGTLVITAMNSSLPEVGGEAAFYVKNENDARELCSLMREVLELEEEKRQERLELGRQQCMKFSWENCAKEVYKELVK